MFKRTACLLSLALLLAALMAGCGGSGSVGGQDPGAAALEGMTPASSGKLHPPTVASTSPAKGATGVAINGKITAIFCQPMARATVTDATFTVMNGSTAVNGTVSFAYRTAIFTPDSNLAPNTEFTATLATGITTYGGLPLANPYIWKFTTGSTEDTVGPAVKSTGPWNGAKDVPTNRQPDVTFNEPIDPSTITKWTFTLKQGTKPVTGDAGSYHETNSTFTPVPILEPLTEYTATLSTGVKDLAGNAMAAPYVWKFTTGPRSDDTRPTVISTSPADGATQVSLNSVITVTFREMVAPSTVTRERFRVLQGTTPILGTVTYAGRTATFTPAQSLTHCTVYTAQMASGVKDKDLSGNLLANDFNWQFTTGLAPVELGLAAPFAVLGGSTVTSPVFSTVTGDLGVWSGTAVTGFPPSTLTGALHAGDAAAHLAQGDLTTAYNDAAGRTCSPVTVAG
ncbi:MAG: Ig-like domain-containing protein, partial [Armatimonadota bacterium]